MDAGLSSFLFSGWGFGILSADADSALARKVFCAGDLGSWRLGGDFVLGALDGPGDGDFCRDLPDGPGVGDAFLLGDGLC